MMHLERLVLTILCLLLAERALAQSSETGGIGGTGIGQETGGIGGTGVDSQPGGIGGTGITRQGKPVLSYGPIQAFGSVFVNGREYMFDNHTLVRVDGHAATIANLSVGNIARIQGVITGAKRGYAESINIIHPVIGPVTAISDGGLQAVILGQKMEATKGPIFAGFKPGQMVAVSAQLRANGTWAADNAEPVSGATAQLLGPVAAHNGRMTVAGTPVTLEPGLTPPAMGSQALVTGAAAENGLVAHRIVPGPSLVAPPGTRVEVSDYFKSDDGKVRAPDGLEVQNLPGGDKLNGLEPVDVSGDLVAPDVVDINAQQDDALSQTPDLSAPEPAEDTEQELTPDGLTPDELTPELPGEPPENPDLDDK